MQDIVLSLKIVMSGTNITEGLTVVRTIPKRRLGFHVRHCKLCNCEILISDKIATLRKLAKKLRNGRAKIGTKLIFCNPLKVWILI